MSYELFDYNDSSKDSILNYTENIINETMGDIIEKYNSSEYKSYEEYQAHEKHQGPSNDLKINVKSKGKYGNYIERFFYGYNINNDSYADLYKAGIEIKVTPFKINKNRTISAKERLVLTILNYMEENLDDFYKTHLWKKCSKILMLFYNGKVPDRELPDYQIEKSFLFEWFVEDMPTIIKDYQNIVQKIKDGHAEDISESDGNYLSTCTKGAGKGKDLREQPFSSVKVKQRAWELKSSYMTHLINNKIFNSDDQEKIKSITTATNTPFTEIIYNKIMKYKGISNKDLFKRFGISERSKNKNNLLIRKILGLTGDIDKTAEFQKANMNLRVLNVKKNNLPTQDSPFKVFDFIELAQNDDWYQSQPYLEISNKRFMFVVFKENKDNDFKLDNVKFWGFPERLDDEVKRVWHETRDIINNGVELSVTKKGVKTNFPQSTKNKVVYTKIHASNSLYEIKKDEFIGKGKLSDTNPLPDGRRITKHSFWLPKKFIQQILDGHWD